MSSNRENQVVPTPKINNIIVQVGKVEPCTTDGQAQRVRFAFDQSSSGVTGNEVNLAT